MQFLQYHTIITTILGRRPPPVRPSVSLCTQPKPYSIAVAHSTRSALFSPPIAVPTLFPGSLPTCLPTLYTLTTSPLLK